MYVFVAVTGAVCLLIGCKKPLQTRAYVYGACLLCRLLFLFLYSSHTQHFKNIQSSVTGKTERNVLELQLFILALLNCLRDWVRIFEKAHSIVSGINTEQTVLVIRLANSR